MRNFSTFIENLQAYNSKSFYLAFLRVALSLWLLKELLINWTSLELLYGKQSFIVLPQNALFQLLHINTDVLQQHYHWLIMLYVIVLSLNLFGIGRHVTALAVYMLVEVFQRMNTLTLNGGDNLIKFVLLYLIFADTYQHFVYQPSKIKRANALRLSNLLSNLAAYSIMLHLCLAYFIAGITKAHADVWYNGIATYYVLSLDRFKGTPFNELFAKNGWFVFISTYGTMLLELYFPVLIWFKRFRIPLIIMGLMLHMSIYLFMMIYGFQFIFLLTYGLFFSNEEISQIKIRITKRFAFLRRIQLTA